MKKTDVEIFKILAVLLTGLLFGVMAAMMYVGGSVSFSAFLQTGAVYDFSGEALTADSDTWSYDGQDECFVIRKKKAVKKLLIDGKESSWGYLYVTVGTLNVPELNAELRYYNKEKEIIYEQPITLVVGENVIALNPEISPYKIGFRVSGAEGVRISFTRMQIREKPIPEVRPVRVAFVFFIAYAVFLVFWLCCRALFCKRDKRYRNGVPGVTLNYIYFSIGKTGESLFGKAKTQKAGELRLQVTFTLLFFLSILGNVLGWSDDSTLYRYQVLGSAALLFLAGIFCRCVFKGRAEWRSPVAYFWLLLWVGTMISDYFAGGNFHFYGYVMLFAAGFFIHRWNQTEHPARMFSLWADALAVNFFVSVVVCVLFRPKLLAVQYNGIFRNPGENAMFALLMFLTFAVELLKLMREGGRSVRLPLFMVGLALAGYLTLRAENRVGYVVLAVLVSDMLCVLFASRRCLLCWLKKNAGIFCGSLLIALFAAAGFHVGTKYLPDMLGVSLVYEDEIRSTQKSQEVLKELAAVMPEYVEELVPAAGKETEEMKKAYLRALNLFGNGGKVKVSGEAVLSDSGYLTMAYRYGIFFLVPFLFYQLAVLWDGAKGIAADRPEGVHTEYLWLVGVMVIYVAFCIRGNAQLPFAHPLWLCVYLGAGCRFPGEESGTLRAPNGDRAYQE